MNQEDYQALLSSLDQAVEILSRHRSPDGLRITAFDTLKQARALIVRSLEQTPAASPRLDELIAA